MVGALIFTLLIISWRDRLFEFLNAVISLKTGANFLSLKNMDNF